MRFLRDEVFPFFTEVADLGYSQLLSQLRIAWLTPKFLPRPTRDLFVGRARLTSIECGVLEAFVIEELQKLKERQQAANVVAVVQINQISGIPPPVDDRLLTPLESNLVA